jgi:hypothetical protein
MLTINGQGRKADWAGTDFFGSDFVSISLVPIPPFTAVEQRAVEAGGHFTSFPLEGRLAAPARDFDSTIGGSMILSIFSIAGLLRQPARIIRFAAARSKS